jgi:hypothetical protein
VTIPGSSLPWHNGANASFERLDDWHTYNSY